MLHKRQVRESIGLVGVPGEMPDSVFDLSGRRALVTGAASGIGAAIARALDRAGARVAVADIDLEQVRLTRSRIPSLLHDRAFTLPA